MNFAYSFDSMSCKVARGRTKGLGHTDSFHRPSLSLSPVYGGKVMKKSVWNDANMEKLADLPGSWGEVSKSVNAGDDSCLTL